MLESFQLQKHLKTAVPYKLSWRNHMLAASGEFWPCPQYAVSVLRHELGWGFLCHVCFWGRGVLIFDPKQGLTLQVLHLVVGNKQCFTPFIEESKGLMLNWCDYLTLIILPEWNTRIIYPEESILYSWISFNFIPLVQTWRLYFWEHCSDESSSW